MTIDLRTASVDEMRDWLAVQQGWKFNDVVRTWFRNDDPPETERIPPNHPIPATLDAIAAVWGTELVEWMWKRSGGWDAWKRGTNTYVYVFDTGDELADRLRLTCLALAAERNIQ